MDAKSTIRGRAAERVPQQERAAADVKDLREMVSALIAKGNGEKAIDTLFDVIESLQQDNQRLTYRLAAAIRARFGRKSERLKAEELGQLVLALGGTEGQAAASDPLVPTPVSPVGAIESEQPSDGDASKSKSKKRRPNHKGRSALSPSLPRNEAVVVPVPADERVCIHCHEEMSVIDHIRHEVIEFIPARIVVNVELREKRACTNCKQDIVTAPRAAPESTKRRVGMSLLAHLVESKCDDALPIYRQRDQLRRLGFDAPLNTLYGYWDYATGMLKPVADAIISKILHGKIVGLDDTRLDFLDPKSPRGKRRGHLWCFVGDGPEVGFVFTETWSAEDIAPWISAIDGLIQCDDYKGYSAAVAGNDGVEQILVPPERRLGCMMHVRRRFHEAYVGRHLSAAIPLKLIADIYRVEAKAKELGLSAEERLALRKKESLPLLDAFDAWVDEHAAKFLPQSPLGSAVRYAKDQRQFVRRCFDDGATEIDNGRVEREIREPAIGRKNFCFAGSASGADRLAAAYTVVQSARRAGAPVRDYLIDILGRLDRGWPAKRLTDLTPERWLLERARTAANEAAQQTEQ
jgi:transposase